MKRPAAWVIAAGVLALAGSAAVAAQAGAAAQPGAADIPSLEQLLPAGGGAVSGRLIQLFGAVTVLSIAPGLLVMVTCFTRFAIALSFLRTGIGLQTTPANMILVSLALFMTLFVMSPVFDQAWSRGLSPLLENKISEKDAYQAITEPFRTFMRANVRDKDLRVFMDLSPKPAGQALAPQPNAGEGGAPVPGAEASPPPSERDLRVLIPAFMLSEIRRGFEIGFLIVLPFLVIDLIVATLTMAMGMMMMPPTVIALPFKVLFFILIDGWNMIAGSLIRSVG